MTYINKDRKRLVVPLSEEETKKLVNDPDVAHLLFQEIDTLIRSFMKDHF